MAATDNPRPSGPSLVTAFLLGAFGAMIGLSIGESIASFIF